MNNKKIKVLIFGALVICINFMPGIASGNDTWNKITINNETCSYQSKSGQLIKKCEHLPVATESIQSPIQSSTQYNPQPHPLALITKPEFIAAEDQKVITMPVTSKPIQKSLANSENQISSFQVNRSDDNHNSFSYFVVTLIFGYFLGYQKSKRSEDYIQDQAEKMVKTELKSLDKSLYCIMHDITLPIGNGTTQIDHIVISEHGIFVIETKSHKGWIFGKENDGIWTQVIKGGKKYTFHSPIVQNSNHIKHIERIANIESNTIKNIVVFTNPGMEFKAARPKYVLKLNELKSYINQSTSTPISSQRVHEIIGCIEFNRKERSEQTNNDHIAFIKSRFKRRS